MWPAVRPLAISAPTHCPILAYSAPDSVFLYRYSQLLGPLSALFAARNGPVAISLVCPVADLLGNGEYGSCFVRCECLML